MAINCLEDLFKLGWRRRIGQRGFTRPSGLVVTSRNKLSEKEKLEIGDILFPGRANRKELSRTLSEPSSPSDSPLPSTSSSACVSQLPATSTSSSDSLLSTASSSHSHSLSPSTSITPIMDVLSLPEETCNLVNNNILIG